MTTSERIKTARQKAGLTQAQLGEKLNLHQNAISAIELDHNSISITRLQDIAAALNIPACELSPAGTIKTNEDISLYIEFICRKTGLTQKQLAEKLNITDITIYSWKAGRQFPNLNTLEKIIHTLEIQVSEQELAEFAKTIETETHVENTTTIGGRIQAARKKADLTQSELAEKLGTSRRLVTGLEHNTYHPSQARLQEVANALNTPIETLIPENQAMTYYAGHQPIKTVKSTETQTQNIQPIELIKAIKTMKTQGQRIRFIRKAANMNQTQFAAAINTRTATVSLWERNQVFPTGPNLQKIATTFQIPIADLIVINTKTNTTIGNRIKIARKQAGLTQKQLAKKLDTTTPIISQWETDSIHPGPVNLQKLADILNIPAASLTSSDLEPSRSELIRAWNRLNKNGKTKLMEQMKQLAELPEYQAANNQ